MIKIIGAFGAAAFMVCGWAVTGAPSQAPSVAPAAAVTGERLDGGQSAADCSHYAWPYYDSACLYDSRSPRREAPKVRFVLIDRLPPRTQSAD